MATLTFSVTTLSGAGTPLHSGTIVLPLTAVTGPSTTTRDACSAGALPLDDGVGVGVGVQAATPTLVKARTIAEVMAVSVRIRNGGIPITPDKGGCNPTGSHAFNLADPGSTGNPNQGGTSAASTWC